MKSLIAVGNRTTSNGDHDKLRLINISTKFCHDPNQQQKI